MERVTDRTLALAVLDAKRTLTDNRHMKAKTPTLTSWPYGLEVQTTSEGLLLKPRRKPREGWAKAFRHPTKSPTDDLAEMRHVRNKFDTEEWKW